MSGKIGLSWTRGRMYFKSDNGFYDQMWKKAKSKSYNSVADAGHTYWDYVTNAASLAAFDQNREADALLSAEALPENTSLMGFKSFAREYPEKLFPLIYKLRAEFQELFIEYYLLEKSQSFIAKAHGQIQTRVWQNLRIIEQTIGSLILLGTEPNEETLRPILEQVGIENTPHGSLTHMILLYASSQNYAFVAKLLGVPVPMIRKIFRPAITALLASKNVKAVAVGAYLRSLTHQASLTGAGLSKRCIARTKRVKALKFNAPPSEDSPILSFGATSTLRDTPWCMFEISSDHRMTQIFPVLRAHGRKLFGKKAAQVFAPTNAEGELTFNYIFARTNPPNLVRTLTRIRGISEMASLCDDAGAFVHAVTVPDAEIQTMMTGHAVAEPPVIHPQDFVEILTGPAARYCGTVVQMNTLTEDLIVEVNFPTGRQFIISADPTCVKLIPTISSTQRAFWGLRLA